MPVDDDVDSGLDLFVDLHRDEPLAVRGDVIVPVDQRNAEIIREENSWLPELQLWFKATLVQVCFLPSSDSVQNARKSSPVATTRG